MDPVQKGHHCDFNGNKLPHVPLSAQNWDCYTRKATLSVRFVGC